MIGLSIPILTSTGSSAAALATGPTPKMGIKADTIRAKATAIVIILLVLISIHTFLLLQGVVKRVHILRVRYKKRTFFGLYEIESSTREHRY